MRSLVRPCARLVVALKDRSRSELGDICFCLPEPRVAPMLVALVPLGDLELLLFVEFILIDYIRFYLEIIHPLQWPYNI